MPPERPRVSGVGGNICLGKLSRQPPATRILCIDSRLSTDGTSRPAHSRAALSVRQPPPPAPSPPLRGGRGNRGTDGAPHTTSSFRGEGPKRVYAPLSPPRSQSGFALAKRGRRRYGPRTRNPG